MTKKLSERGTIILTDHLLKNGEPQRSKVNDEVAALEQRVERSEHEKFIVWEGDESEGRWRCLMCGNKREGEDDTGPEGIEHYVFCGEEGQPIWAYERMKALAEEEATHDHLPA